MTTTTLDGVRATAPAVRKPALSAALRAQLVLLWRMRRVAFLFALLFGALALIEFIVWRLNPNNVTSTGVVAEMLSLLVVAGGVWSLLVWRDEEPAKRHYHWSLPVDVTAHDAVRVAAGAAWLVAALLAFWAAVFVLAAVHGEVAYLRQLGTGQLLSFVLVPLLTYTLVSVLTVGTDRPLHWIVGLYFGLVIVMITADAAGVGAGLIRLANAVFGPSPGLSLGFAFTGVSRGYPVGSWLSAWLFWLLIAAAGIAAVSAARRRRG
jgi:hypothetical protein